MLKLEIMRNARHTGACYWNTTETNSYMNIYLKEFVIKRLDPHLKLILPIKNCVKRRDDQHLIHLSKFMVCHDGMEIRYHL